MTDFFNLKSEKQKRSHLRNSMPKAEVILWSKLKAKQLCGIKFRRQYSVGPYVIDFFCTQLKLAIELDGDSHFINDSQKYDAERQSYIEQFGIRFLRFTNTDIYENLEGVLQTIADTAKELE